MIASLVRSPAFQELVSYYQERRDEETFQLTSRIQSLASDALEELEDRINGEAIDDVKTKDLAGIATSLLDRAGHSPVSRRESRNLHVHLTEDDISEIKREAAQKKIINGEATQVD